MQEILNRLILKFRVSKIDNSGIHGPILLNEIFHHNDKNSKSKLVEGYLKLYTNVPEVCWHVWVDVDGVIYDFNKTVAIIKDPEFASVKVEYLLESENVEKPEELYEQFKLYKDDKREFWKKSPSSLKNLRSKIFKKL
jgi:hypothetical protein